MLELFERREPVDIVTVAEVLERTGQLDAHRRAGPTCRGSATRRRPPSTRSSTRGSSSARRCCGTSSPPPARSPQVGYQDPADVEEAIDRAESELFAVSKERRLGRLQPPALAAPRGLRPARLPPRPPRRDQRRGQRLRGPRRADDGLPAQRPDHPRRPPVRRQDQPRAQHRRARRRPREADRGRVQPRDEQGAAGAAPALERRQHRFEEPALGLPRGDGLRAPGARHEQPLRGADLHRRHAQHRRDGAADQGAPAPGGGRPRPPRRRLPPADAGARRVRATPTGSRRSPRSRADSRRSRASSTSRSSRCPS